MKRINIVDCTLRDGGWVNEFQFGNESMNEIVQVLEKAGIDYLELGYVDENKYSEGKRSLYKNFEDLSRNFHKIEKSNQIRMVMIDYGKFPVEELPDCNNMQESMIQGIRVCFHKKDVDNAILMGKKILEKGYILFMQPMVTTRYTEEEFVDLIQRLQNELKGLSGFYVVDSFGSMTPQEIINRLLLADCELDTDIILGLHTHNNLNLSLTNAQAACELVYGTGEQRLKEGRILNIDATLLGMGKGAGNLCTEEIVSYLNDVVEDGYDLESLKEFSHRTIKPFFEKNPWGCTPEYALTAKYCVTPTYAKAFVKAVHTLEELERLLAGMPAEKKDSFDPVFAEEYLRKNAAINKLRRKNDEGICDYTGISSRKLY